MAAGGTILAAQLAVVPMLACNVDPDDVGPSQPTALIDNTNAIVATDGGGNTVGTVPGKFAVTADGQASYKVPIWTPTGVHGVEPSLSLNYNSGNGMSTMGVGWKLSGFPLSTITRCRRTIAIDGEAGTVDFTDDVYCLDGKRLLPIAGGFQPEHDDGVTVVVEEAAAAPAPVAAPGAPQEDEERRVLQSRAITYGRDERDRLRWPWHLLNVGVGAGYLAILGFGYHHWESGVWAGASALVIGEAQTLTQPTGSTRFASLALTW